MLNRFKRRCLYDIILVDRKPFETQIQREKTYLEFGYKSLHSDLQIFWSAANNCLYE